MGKNAQIPKFECANIVHVLFLDVASQTSKVCLDHPVHREVVEHQVHVLEEFTGEGSAASTLVTRV
jgi:hypothetical protein